MVAAGTLQAHSVQVHDAVSVVRSVNQLTLVIHLATNISNVIHELRHELSVFGTPSRTDTVRHISELVFHLF